MNSLEGMSVSFMPMEFVICFSPPAAFGSSAVASVKLPSAARARKIEIEVRLNMGSMLNIAVRQCLLEFLYASVRDLRAYNAQVFEFA